MSTVPYSDLQVRLRTAGMLIVCFASILLLAVLFPPLRYLLGVLELGVVCAAAWELSRLFDSYPLRWAVMAMAIFGLLVAATTQSVTELWVVFALLMLFGKGQGRGWQSMAVLWTSLLFVGVGGGYLMALSPVQLAALITAVALNDATAYSVGKKIGVVLLAPTISPKKTVSGSVAGLLVGSVSALLLGVASGPLNAVLMIASAQAGDLIKSRIKRQFGIKDFSNLLPGHGGVLDWIDGFLGAVFFI